ncbi:MAG: hypothetical protein ACLUE2_11590 [Bacteroides cellulosilyticus]
MMVDVPPDASRLLQKYRNRAESEYLFPILNETSPGKERYHLYQDTLRRFNRELARLMKKLPARRFREFVYRPPYVGDTGLS